MEQYLPYLEWAFNISIWLFVIPLLMLLIRRKFLNFPLWLFALQVMRALFFSILGLYLSNANINNHLLFYLSPCLDLVLVSLMTLHIFNHEKVLKWALAVVCVVFIGLMAVDYLKLHEKIYSLLSTAETIFVIVATAFMLRKVVIEYKSGFYKYALIWLLAAQLFSNAFNVLFTALMKTIAEQSTSQMYILWYLLSPISTLINMVMITYGFYILKAKPRA